MESNNFTVNLETDVVFSSIYKFKKTIYIWLKICLNNIFTSDPGLGFEKKNKHNTHLVFDFIINGFKITLLEFTKGCQFVDDFKEKFSFVNTETLFNKDNR